MSSSNMKATVYSVLFVSFFAATFARDVPKLMEAFTATVRVELHTYDGNLMFGSGVIVRDGKTKAFERSEMESQMNFRLDRYDMDKGGMEYYFRGNKSESHCSMISPNRTSLFPFWGWLSNATFIGVRDIEHRSMALYENEDSGVRFVLGVDPTDNTVPLMLERRSEFQSAIVSFATFKKYDEASDAKYFTIPKQCQ